MNISLDVSIFLNIRLRKITEIQQDINREVIGRRVRIIRDWHDQPLGRSKKNLRGTEHTVAGTCFTESIRNEPRLALWLDGLRCAVWVDYVEWIDVTPGDGNVV